MQTIVNNNLVHITKCTLCIRKYKASIERKTQPPLHLLFVWPIKNVNKPYCT